MRYKVIFTHDPQDYFNGVPSAEETSERIEFPDTPSGCLYGILNIMGHVDAGYKAIVMPIEGDDSG